MDFNQHNKVLEEFQIKKMGIDASRPRSPAHMSDITRIGAGVLEVERRVQAMEQGVASKEDIKQLQDTLLDLRSDLEVLKGEREHA